MTSREPDLPISEPISETMMDFTRRDFVWLSLGLAASTMAKHALAQGMATHTTKPMARPAPSGRPFNARFVDIAASAGLRSPVIYGGVESKRYILEATGCGCAFFDYDTYRWRGIFFLFGTPLCGDPPET